MTKEKLKKMLNEITEEDAKKERIRKRKELNHSCKYDYVGRGSSDRNSMHQGFDND